MFGTDSTSESRKKQYTLIFNIAVMISSFTIALIALPMEIFFVVAVVILYALRDIEKDLSKSPPGRFTMSATGK